MHMQYKTIMLQFLEQHPEIAEPLRRQRTMLLTLDHYSDMLKTRHESWTEQLAKRWPGSDPSQIASEALEMALAEVEHRLCGEPDGSPGFSLDAAMSFLRRHTPPA